MGSYFQLNTYQQANCSGEVLYYYYCSFDICSAGGPTILHHINSTHVSEEFYLNRKVDGECNLLQDTIYITLNKCEDGTMAFISEEMNPPVENYTVATYLHFWCNETKVPYGAIFYASVCGGPTYDGSIHKI